MRKAVVLTYPGHFFLSKVCIDSIKRHISDLESVVVIADNISPHTWPTYLDDCKQLYGTEILATSDHQLMWDWKDNPWIRQQMVKFHLDSFIDEDVFFVDGDCKFFYDVPKYCTPYTITKYSGVPLTERDPMPGEVTSQQQNYINTVLQNNIPTLEDPKKIVRKGTTVGTSGCPFRDIKIDIVKLLREHVETIHHVQNNIYKSFSEIHQHYQFNTTLSISEWELYERFRKYILSQELDMVFYPPHSHHDSSTYNDKLFFATCFSSDRSLGADWFKSQNVPDVDLYWDKLPHTK